MEGNISAAAPTGAIIERIALNLLRFIYIFD